MTRFSRREALKAGAALAISAACPRLSHAADPYAGAQLVAGEPPSCAAGAFTIAVLPDTQNYSERYPQTYLAQTRWIVENQQRRNIACVLHLGDITNHNTPAEWEHAVQAMDALHGHVPYCMVPGNHDYSQGGGCRDRTTRLNEYFPLARLREQTGFGGVYDKEPERVENSFQLFSAAGHDFLVLGLEFGPRDDVVRWANEVVASHRDRQAILITHAYMYFDDTRYDWQKYGDRQTWNPHSYGVAQATDDDVNDGEALWQKLVSRHDNFVLAANGHVLNDGLGRTVSSTSSGRQVPQMLVNFQMKPKGGDGWLRLLEFRPDKTIHTYDYSPTRGERNESPDNQFVVPWSV